MENLSCLSRRRVKHRHLTDRYRLPPFSGVMLAEYPEQTGTRIPHTHNEFQIIIQMSGAIRFTAGGEFVLHTGDVLLLPAGTRHAWSVLKRGKTLQLLLSPGLPADYPELCPILVPEPVRLFLDPEPLETLWEELIGEQEKALPGTALVIHARLLELLARILRACSAARRGVTARTNEGVVKALDLIASRYREKLTLHRLASTAGLSISRFSALFRDLTGRSPVDFLLNYRLERAAELLESTDLKVYEAAERTGFSSLAGFNRKYKAVYGHSPRAGQKKAYGETDLSPSSASPSPKKNQNQTVQDL